MAGPIARIGFGGGCHWCTEAVFKSLKGVAAVAQGYVSPLADPSSFSEGVIVNYYSDCVKLATLIEIHLITHKSSEQHSMRDKYRSAIYTFEDPKHTEVLETLKNVKKRLGIEVITKVLEFGEFTASREEITDYYYKNPSKPFCRKFIDPKLKTLLKTHQKHLKIDQLNHLF